MTRIVALACAALLALPACSNSRHARVADVATTVTDPSLEGQWQVNNNRTLVITRSGKDHYTVKPSDSDSSYDACLIDVNGKRFAELAVYDAKNSKEVPVYLYGGVDVKGDTLTFRRLRAEWLERASKGEEGVAFKSTNDVQPRSGGVVVSDPAKLHELLQKAAMDPAALGEPEVGRRVK